MQNKVKVKSENQPLKYLLLQSSRSLLLELAKVGLTSALVGE